MTEQAKTAGVPAWKLRQQMKSGQASGAQSNAALDVQAKLKKKMEQAALDPHLPAAFKVANKERLAFVKQQARRKNNDTFMSMNSSHPAPKQPVVAVQDDSDDSSYASMGEDSFE